jgi:DNA-binding transcriptional regulator LsrR (DeoR family)
MTQDQIAAELGVSRQRAQRLVSRAMAEGLIHVRLNHRSEPAWIWKPRLMRRFGLMRCRVVPSPWAGRRSGHRHRSAAAAAESWNASCACPIRWSSRLAPGGRCAVDGGCADPDGGRTTPSGVADRQYRPRRLGLLFDVVMRIADKVRAPHYPMPVPVISPHPEERAAFHAPAPVQTCSGTGAGKADVVVVGVGQMSDDAPLLAGRLRVTDAELDVRCRRLGRRRRGGGLGLRFGGRYLDLGINNRTGGVRVDTGQGSARHWHCCRRKQGRAPSRRD